MSAVSAGERAHDPALVHDRDPIGQGQDLVEVLADQQDRGAAARRSSSSRWTVSIAPTSRPRVGWTATISAGPEFDLAREDQPLQVATRQQPRLGVDRRRGDAYSSLRPSASARAARVVEEPAARDRRLAVALHDQVVGDRQVRARCRRRAGPPERARRRAGSHGRPAGWRRRSPSTRTLPRHGRRPVMTSASSDWPLPATPAMPTISPPGRRARRPRSAGRPRSLSAVTSRTASTTCPAPAASARRPRARRDRPSAGPGRRRSRPARGRGGHLAAAHDRDPVGDGEDLAELVADEHDAAPSAVIARRVRNSSSISCGASTAVGSSMIRIRAPR